MRPQDYLFLRRCGRLPALVFWRLAWLVVPLFGLGELGAHFYFSSRPPTLESWQELRGELSRQRKRDELVVIAPSWAEPLARHAFGDELMPLAQLARPDATGFSRAIEVGARGARSSELAGWRTLQTSEHGPFVLRVLENPNYAPTVFDFVDAVARGRAEVSVRSGGTDEACPYSVRSRSATGGLHGPIAYPRERFRCGGDDSFVGVSVIDDQDYRPRRCILARTPRSGSLLLRFAGVPVGQKIRGFAGLSYFLHRDGKGAPVNLQARVGNAELGRYQHREETGWHPFVFSATAGESVDVEFEVQSPGSGRDFCFFADSR